MRKGGTSRQTQECPPTVWGQESQTLPSVRPHLGCESLPCVSADREYRPAAVGCVPDRDHGWSVTDLNTVTAVGSAVRGLPPSADVACCFHVIATSAMNSSDRVRESASSRRSSNMIAAWLIRLASSTVMPRTPVSRYAACCSP